MLKKRSIEILSSGRSLLLCAIATENETALRSQGSGGTAGAAFIAFLRNGVYGTYLGIDTDNNLKIGGWSAGAAAYKLWHEGNDGSGSGLNADLLDGIDSTWIPYGNNAGKSFYYANTGDTPNTLFSSQSTGFWDCYNTSDLSKFPNNTYNHWHGINVRHGNLSNAWGWQLANTYYTEEWYARKVQGGSFSPWRRFWHDGNFNPSNYLPLAGGTLTSNLKFQAVGDGTKFATHSFTSTNSEGDIFHLYNIAIDDVPSGNSNIAQFGVAIGSASLGFNKNGLNIFNSGGAPTLKIQSTQVLGSRKTGWATPTGTISRNTWDTSTITLNALAQKVGALISDLTAHGLIGT